MKLFKLLNKLTQDNLIEIVDSNDETILCGHLNENSSLSLKLLSAKVISFGPIDAKSTDNAYRFSTLVEEYEKIKDEINELYKCSDISVVTNMSVLNIIKVKKLQKYRVLRACMCDICAIPTKIKVDIIKEQLSC